MTAHIIQAFLLALVGGFLYRWRGHAGPYKKYFPRPFNQIAFALPYALATIPQAATLWGPSWWWAPPVLVLTTAAVLTGHGQYFPDLQAKKITPERFDVLLRPFFGKDPRCQPANWIPGGGYSSDADFYQWAIDQVGRDRLGWRCFWGMALTGLAITLPAGIAFANPFLALSGVVKALGYQISEDGAMREFYAGFLLYFLLGLGL